MIKLSSIEKFQLHCLENYKIVKNMSGKNALLEFEQNKVFDFLASGYPVLHTQGTKYMVAEIIDLLAKKK
jgi:hypothetical protein